MNLIKQETQSKIESFNFKRMYPKKKKVRKIRKDLCPDCAAALHINGRCWFCAYCGWSTCP
jgi:hypothetical protein